MKKYVFLQLLLLIIIDLNAQDLSVNVLSAIKNGQRYYSNSNNSYAVPVEFSNSITDKESGLFLSKNGQEKFIYIPWLIGASFVDWSENDSFFVIDNGTYAIRGLICFNSDTEEKIGNIQYVANQYILFDDKYILTTSQDGYRADDYVERFSIILHVLNSDSIESYTIFESTEIIDYDNLKLVNDRTVEIEKINYVNTNTESPWERYKMKGKEGIEINFDELLRKIE